MSTENFKWLFIVRKKLFNFVRNALKQRNYTNLVPKGKKPNTIADGPNPIYIYMLNELIFKYDILLVF